MIEKLKIPKTINWDDTSDSYFKRHFLINNAYEKINELVDAVNSIISVQEKLIDSRFVVETKHEATAENVQPNYVTTSYMTDGHTKEYYGQNGASIVTNYPLPAGYVITIRELGTKGDSNE